MAGLRERALPHGRGPLERCPHAGLKVHASQPTTDTTGKLMLVALGFCWGLTWPAMRFALDEIPPFSMRVVTLGLGGGALMLYAKLNGCSLAIGGWKDAAHLVVSSILNVLSFSVLSVVAMLFAATGRVAMLAYTMPIWAMLLAWPALGERPTIRGLIALLLGVFGLGLLFGGEELSFGADKLLGIALALSCAILFALGNVLNRKPLPMPPLVVVAWQVGLGCAVMLVLGIAFEHPNVGAITPVGLACFVYMTLVPMGLCYLTWFETLRRLPPTSASTGMLLVPVIGVVSAAFILGEPLGLREVAAMALTLGGVTLALQKA